MAIILCQRTLLCLKSHLDKLQGFESQLSRNCCRAREHDMPQIVCLSGSLSHIRKLDIIDETDWRSVVCLKMSFAHEICIGSSKCTSWHFCNTLQNLILQVRTKGSDLDYMLKSKKTYSKSSQAPALILRLWLPI